MIIRIITEDGMEKQDLVADGVIVDVPGKRLHVIAADGDVAPVSFSPDHPILIQDEGGDEGEQAAG